MWRLAFTDHGYCILILTVYLHSVMEWSISKVHGVLPLTFTGFQTFCIFYCSFCRLKAILNCAAWLVIIPIRFSIVTINPAKYAAPYDITDNNKTDGYDKIQDNF